MKWFIIFFKVKRLKPSFSKKKCQKLTKQTVSEPKQQMHELKIIFKST